MHAGSRCVQRLVFRARMEVHVAARARPRRAHGPGGTHLAVGPAEQGLDAWATVRGADCAPGPRCIATRAGHPFTVPVDGEVPPFLARPHASRDAPDGPFERKAVVPS